MFDTNFLTYTSEEPLIAQTTEYKKFLVHFKRKEDEMLFQLLASDVIEI